MQSSEASPDADSCGPTDSIPAVRIWGPVPKEQAVAVGALAAVSSMVLAPQQAPARLFNSLAQLSSQTKCCPGQATPRKHCASASRAQPSSIQFEPWRKGTAGVDATSSSMQRRIHSRAACNGEHRRCPSTLTALTTCRVARCQAPFDSRPSARATGASRRAGRACGSGVANVAAARRRLACLKPLPGAKPPHSETALPGAKPPHAETAPRCETAACQNGETAQ